MKINRAKARVSEYNLVISNLGTLVKVLKTRFAINASYSFIPYAGSIILHPGGRSSKVSSSTSSFGFEENNDALDEAARLLLTKIDIVFVP